MISGKHKTNCTGDMNLFGGFYSIVWKVLSVGSVSLFEKLQLHCRVKNYVITDACSNSHVLPAARVDVVSLATEASLGAEKTFSCTASYQLWKYHSCRQILTCLLHLTILLCAKAALNQPHGSVTPTAMAGDTGFPPHSPSLLFISVIWFLSKALFESLLNFLHSIESPNLITSAENMVSCLIIYESVAILGNTTYDIFFNSFIKVFNF